MPTQLKTLPRTNRKLWGHSSSSSMVRGQPSASVAIKGTWIIMARFHRLRMIKTDRLPAETSSRTKLSSSTLCRSSHLLSRASWWFYLDRTTTWRSRQPSRRPDMCKPSQNKHSMAPTHRTRKSHLNRVAPFKISIRNRNSRSCQGSQVAYLWAIRLHRL